MTETWEQAWGEFSRATGMGERHGQQQMGREVFANVAAGGQLMVQAPTGTGKSVAYLIPLVLRAEAGEKCVVSTETLALLDQLVDQDLPMVVAALGRDVEFCGLKGRSHYLCHNVAGSGHPIASGLAQRDLGRGERADVERAVGRELTDEEWRGVASEPEFCGTNRCASKACYSSRARERADRCGVVVTSHAMLRTHGEMISQDNDGVLGPFRHLVVDEAHTLEQVLVDGGTLGMAPWELDKWAASISKGAASGRVPWSACERAEKATRDALQDIADFMWLLKDKPHQDQWDRAGMRLGLYYMSGGSDPALLSALDAYEERARRRLSAASKEYVRLAAEFRAEADDAARGKRKLKVAASACARLGSVTGLMAIAMGHRDALVEAYGSTYALIADGYTPRHRFASKGRKVSIRAVPLDVSGFARDALWSRLKSATLVSATISDPTDGSFRYAKRSLGLSREECAELSVATPFSYADQQLVYLTPGVPDPVSVPGARYDLAELMGLLSASSGRALVLFTSRAELDHAAAQLASMRAAGSFPWPLLVQTRESRKSSLAEQFKAQESSVLLATKSFFTGVNFEGEACSLVALCKWPNPKWDDLTRSQVAYWKERGFPRWYEARALEVFAQASGRLIRSTTDRGVVALLDGRVAEEGSVSGSLGRALPVLYPGSEVTGDAARVAEFLA